MKTKIRVKCENNVLELWEREKKASFLNDKTQEKKINKNKKRNFFFLFQNFFVE